MQFHNSTLHYLSIKIIFSQNKSQRERERVTNQAILNLLLFVQLGKEGTMELHFLAGLLLVASCGQISRCTVSTEASGADDIRWRMLSGIETAFAYANKMVSYSYYICYSYNAYFCIAIYNNLPD